MSWILIAGSIAGVLALYWLCRLLGLGAEVRINGAEHAMRLAEEAHCGFEPVAAIVDRGGYAALLRNAAGRHMLIRAHGSHFVSRFVEPPFEGRLDRRMLTLSFPDRMFGSVTLDLGDQAATWASGLRRARGARDV